MPKQFLRQETARHSKVGKNRKKLQKWRKPKGRDSKMRLKRKSYPKTVSIGYSSPRSELKETILIHNTNDLKKVKENSRVILANVGAKKKLEILKVANEMKIRLQNVRSLKK